MAVVAIVAVSVVINLIEAVRLDDKLIAHTGVGSIPSSNIVSRMLVMVKPFTHFSLFCGKSKNVLGIKTSRALAFHILQERIIDL